MSKVTTIYNTTSLSVTLEKRNGELIPFTIGEGNAHSDKNGIIVNFSAPNKYGGYDNYVLSDKYSTKDKALNVLSDYIVPFGLAFLGSSLVKKGVNKAIKDPNEAKNVNLALTITSMRSGVKGSFKNLISDNFKSLIDQWYDHEVAYYEVSSGVELNIKPIKVNLPSDAVKLFN